MNEHILALATELAKRAAVLEQIAICNANAGTAEYISIHAQYILAYSAWAAADRAYREAIAGLSSAELAALSRMLAPLKT